jgi:hypothetical protein
VFVSFGEYSKCELAFCLIISCETCLVVPCAVRLAVVQTHGLFRWFDGQGEKNVTCRTDLSDAFHGSSSGKNEETIGPVSGPTGLK